MAHTWTWQKLAQNAYRLNPKSRGPKYPGVPRFEFGGFVSGQNKDQKVIVPYKGTNSLLISMRAWGVTQASLHNVTLLFSNVEILTENPNNSNYFQVQYNGIMYWCKKLDKTRNPLTSRCTCFTGDTKILLADGTTKTFKELEGQSGFDVISYNEKLDKFETVTAYNCEKKQEGAEIVRIILDNGKHIDCTPDHKFLTREGLWIDAKDLQEGESLRALYLDTNKMKRLLPDGKKESIKKHKAKSDFYIYVYLDPRYPGNYSYNTCSFDYKPIYVGKGINNRCNSHLHSDATDRFHNTVRKLCEMGTPPIIVRQQIGLEEHVAYELEKQLTEEIGLENEGKGTLLNVRHGGLGGISQSTAATVKMKNIENGSFEMHRKRMLTDNPMKKEENKQRMVETYKFLYSDEERIEIARHASYSRTEETFKKISESLKNSEIAQKIHKENGKKLGQLAKQRAKEGTLHTQTEEWKDICSKNSKKNWENPEIRKKMIETRKLNRINNPKKVLESKKSCAYKKALKPMIELIKAQGFYSDETFDALKSNGFPKSLKLKELGIYDKIVEDAHKQALTNHKVAKVEKLHILQDVYCLTAEHLGNFVVDCGDEGSHIFSGVTVHNCADFFFTFSFYNYNAGCLYGTKPRPYKRLTTTRPPRNPHGIIGFCKHVYHSWVVLRNSGLTLN